MTEPKPSALYISANAECGMRNQPRSVTIVVSVEWAQAVTRLQQLHNEGCTLVRLLEDERGRVRVEPE